MMKFIGKWIALSLVILALVSIGVGSLVMKGIHAIEDEPGTLTHVQKMENTFINEEVEVLEYDHPSDDEIYEMEFGQHDAEEQESNHTDEVVVNGKGMNH